MRSSNVLTCLHHVSVEISWLLSCKADWCKNAVICEQTTFKIGPEIIGHDHVFQGAFLSFCLQFACKRIIVNFESSLCTKFVAPHLRAHKTEKVVFFWLLCGTLVKNMKKWFYAHVHCCICSPEWYFHHVLFHTQMTYSGMWSSFCSLLVFFLPT